MTIPTLETPRLILRVFVPEDREAIVAMLADTDAMQHMHTRHGTTSSGRSGSIRRLRSLTRTIQKVLDGQSCERIPER